MERPGCFLKFVHDVDAEQQRAAAKFPKADKLLGALAEEFGELAEALLKITESGESPENVYTEAVQVAATVYRLAALGEPTYEYKGMKCVHLGCKQPVTGGPCVLCYE